MSFSPYFTEIIQTAAVVVVALIVYFLFRHYLSLRPRRRKRPHTVVLFTIILLTTLFLVDVWGERVSIIGFVEAYTKRLPGYSTIILLACSALTSYLLHLGLLKKLSHGDQDLTTLHKVRRIARWAGLGAFLVLTAVVLMFSVGWKDAGTFLGLVGAGIALSLQESILCFVGWLHIIVNRVYDIGDRVEIDGHKGDIINITLTHTQLLEVGTWTLGEQSTGRIHTIANSKAFRTSVFNYTHGFPFVWSELGILVTFESDWQQAKEAMLEIANGQSEEIIDEVKRRIDMMKQQYAINYRHLTPTVYTSIQDSGVRLELRFLSPVRDRRTREHKISQEILEAFDKFDNVDFAYPTTRFFKGSEEVLSRGKESKQ